MANKTKYAIYAREFKVRTLYIMFSLLITFLLAYQKALQLTYVFVLSFTSGNGATSLTSPQGGSGNSSNQLSKSFIFTDMQEAFSSIIFVCIMICLFFCIPFIVYQSLCFLSPSWYLHEKNKRCCNALRLLFCWTIYILSIHCFVIPQVCSFLLSFQIMTTCLNITVQAKIFSYVSWTATLLSIACVLFVLAIILSLYFLYNISSIKDWSKYRKIFAWSSLLLAALVSPPEPLTQLILAFILYICCEALLWICFVHESIPKAKVKQ